VFCFFHGRSYIQIHSRSSAPKKNCRKKSKYYALQTFFFSFFFLFSFFVYVVKQSFYYTRLLVIQCMHRCLSCHRNDIDGMTDSWIDRWIVNLHYRHHSHIRNYYYNNNYYYYYCYYITRDKSDIKSINI
jgi:hypothetical protein